MATGLIFLTDNFTGTGRVDARTPDVDVYGRGWNVTYGVAANLLTYIDLAYVSSGLVAAGSALLADLESQDYVVTGVWANNVATSSNYAAIQARKGSGGSYYARMDGGGTVALREEVGTGEIVRGTYSIPGYSASTYYTIKLSCVGNVITVHVNSGPARITYTAEQVITNITQANPAVVTIAGHGLGTNCDATIPDGGGMAELDGWSGTITKLTADTFSLDGVDSTAYTAYSSGGQLDHPHVGEPRFFMSLVNTGLTSIEFQYDSWVDTQIGSATAATVLGDVMSSTHKKTSGGSSAASSVVSMSTTSTKKSGSSIAFVEDGGMASTGANAALVNVSGVEDVAMSATSKKTGSSNVASVSYASMSSTYTAVPNVNYAVISWRVMDTATPPAPITGLNPTTKLFDPISLQSYDFNDSTFKATASCTTLTGTLIERDATYYPGYYDYQLNPENLGLADADKEYQLDLVAVDGVTTYYGEQTLVIRDGVEQLGGAGIAEVKAKTDSLTFTTAGEVDSNVHSVNDVTIVGDGSITPFNV